MLTALALYGFSVIPAFSQVLAPSWEQSDPLLFFHETLGRDQEFLAVPEAQGRAVGQNVRPAEAVCDVSSSEPFVVWEVFLSVSGKPGEPPPGFNLDSGLQVVETGKNSKQLRIRLVPDTNSQKTLASTRVFSLKSQKDQSTLKDIRISIETEPGWLDLGSWFPNPNNPEGGKFYSEGPQLLFSPGSRISFSRESKSGGLFKRRRRELSISCRVP